MKRIVVVGEILAEIMADDAGEGFDRPIALTGPYPSGAPAIFASQAARLGQPCAIVSAVGDDDFGRMNLDRLRGDGVDVSGVRVDPDRPTGTAFVRYRPDGGRAFVFNLRHSACGTLAPDAAGRAVLEAADHLHVMGSSLAAPGLADLALAAAAAIKARSGTVSFDPNLRPEMLGAPGMAKAMAGMLALADLFLPSGDELTLLTRADDAPGALTELAAMGTVVAHKLGAEGARLHDREGTLVQAPFAVREVDPTGAGDCFGGAFTALWLRGVPRAEALRLAAAAGAHAVGVRGPMQGVGDRAALERLAATAKEAR